MFNINSAGMKRNEQRAKLLRQRESYVGLWQDVGRLVDMDISLVFDLQVLKHAENKQAPNEIKQHFTLTVMVSPD